jgi:5-methylcytosine-specific restriction endonuclease McrA
MTRMTKGQKDYMERLRDPRWQRVRLRVLERAEWKCEGCGTGEVNLQVHHGWYERGLMPWEYPDGALYCLCDHCHERAESLRADAYKTLGLIPPWFHAHATVLLHDLQLLLAAGATQEELDDLRVQRTG